MRNPVVLIVLSFFVASSVCSSPIWNEIPPIVDNFTDISNCIVVVGDYNGLRYTYTKGNLGWTDIIDVASASKWVTSLLTMKLIDEGKFNLNTKVNTIIPWWTQDSADMRSSVNITHLLSFTTGTGADQSCCGSIYSTLDDCAQKVYNAIQYQPGTHFYYGANHMTILARLIEFSMNDTFNNVFTNLMKPALNITPANTTVYTPPNNPLASGGLHTSTDNYLKILQTIYSKEWITNKALFDQFEQDTTPQPGVTMVYDPTDGIADWHYSYGHWIECYANDFYAGNCSAQEQYSSPGLYGFYPWIDRVNNYYGMIATYNPLKPYTTSVDLGILIKPTILEALADDRANEEVPSDAIRLVLSATQLIYLCIMLCW